jgi:hypothetical protein
MRCEFRDVGDLEHIVKVPCHGFHIPDAAIEIVEFDFPFFPGEILIDPN